ncbi:MAG TPA: ABC transporter permease [Candidatus Eisenbacteria bacterium]|nr:ABC transporter permease [Candidatus Eisenbacteria bacterium]
MTAHRLRSMIWKEFIQMRRDRATLAMMLGIPVIQLLVFGFAIRMDVRHLPMAVWDQSHTQESRELIQKLQATDNFTVTRHVESYDEAVRLIDRGTARAAIVIPVDYARRLKRGRSSVAQLLVDASDPNTSQNAIAAAQLVGQRKNIELLSALVGAKVRTETPPVDIRVRPLYNPALKSAIFIVPGIIGLILSVTMLLITSMSVVREREQGTLEQLIVTPITRGEIMIGKIAPYVLVGYVQLTAVLTLGHFIFQMPVRGSLLVVYAVTFLFITANLGLGLFISTLAKTQAQSMQGSYFFFLPNVLLSGFMFPREGMPHVAREIGLLFPLTYYIQILRGVVLKGANFLDVLPQTLMLLLLALVFFGFSVNRFQKRLG